MKKIIALTFSLLFIAAINAQQTAPAAAKATTYADKQKRADERAKATASINAYKASEHKGYTAKPSTKPVTETKTTAPVVRSAEYNKRAEERANRTNPKSFNEKKKTAATK